MHFASTPTEFKTHLKNFVTKIPRSEKASPLFVPPGTHTMGGVSNAEERFDNSLAAMYEKPSGNIDEVAERAIGLAKDIVEMHVFSDGNGRAALYTLYLEMANHGWKFSIKPIHLHAFVFGEEQKGKVPTTLNLVLRDLSYSEPFFSSLRNHLTRVQEQLIDLEDTREELAAALDGYSSKDVKPEKNGPLVSWRMWTNKSATEAIKFELKRRELEGKNQLKRHLKGFTTQEQETLAQFWVKQITQDIGHVPSSSEILSWLRMNWPD